MSKKKPRRAGVEGAALRGTSTSLPCALICGQCSDHPVSERGCLCSVCLDPNRQTHQRELGFSCMPTCRYSPWASLWTPSAVGSGDLQTPKVHVLSMLFSPFTL